MERNMSEMIAKSPIWTHKHQQYFLYPSFHMNIWMEFSWLKMMHQEQNGRGMEIYRYSWRGYTLVSNATLSYDTSFGARHLYLDLMSVRQRIYLDILTRFRVGSIQILDSFPRLRSILHRNHSLVLYILDCGDDYQDRCYLGAMHDT